MTAEPFEFFSAGRRLIGTLQRPNDTGGPAAIPCHGFGSYDNDVGGLTRLADVRAKAGIGTLRFSFSGSGPYPEKGTIQPVSEWGFDALRELLIALGSRNGNRRRLGLLPSGSPNIYSPRRKE